MIISRVSLVIHVQEVGLEGEGEESRHERKQENEGKESEKSHQDSPS